MQTGQWRSLIIVFLLGMAALHAAILWQMRDLIQQGYGDFAAFYTGAKLLQQGEAASLYDRAAEWRIQRDFASQVRIRQGPIPYIRPPFEALIFLPFAYLGYAAAGFTWMVLKVALLFVIAGLLRPHLPSPLTSSTLLLGILFLSLFPVAADLLEGQDAVLLLLVFVCSWLALRSGGEWQAGICLALGLFKFHLVIPIFLVFLFRRQFKFVGGFLSAATALLVISRLLLGSWKHLAEYPMYLWDLSHAHGAGLVTPQSMPNFRGLLGTLAGGPPVPDVINYLSIFLALAGAIFSAALWRSRDDSDPQFIDAGFSLAVVVMLVTSFYANSYDLILLLVPLTVMSKTFSSEKKVKAWARRVALLAVGLFLLSPLWWLLALRTKYSGSTALLMLLLLGFSIISAAGLLRSAPTGA